MAHLVNVYIKAKMRFLLFLFLTFQHSYAEVLFSDESYWKKLLHYKNDTYSISSQEFFLSGKLNPTLSEELNATLKVLNSSDGQQIACRFPARYIWLKSKTDLPKYNLNECTKLKHFVSFFPLDEIDLLYKVGTFSSTQSAFGHNYLLFKNKNTSYDSALAVDVTAKIKKQFIFDHLHDGFSGNYKARYHNKYFYKELNKEIADNHSFILYKLNLTPEESRMIIYHLYELDHIDLRYYYLNGNCTSYLDDLLSLIHEGANDYPNFIDPPSELSKIYSDRITQMGSITLDDYHYKYNDNNLTKNEKFHYLKKQDSKVNYNTVQTIDWTDFNKPSDSIINDPSTISIDAYSRKDSNGIAINYSYYDKSIQTQYKKIEQRADLSLLTIGLDIKNDHTSLNRFDLINFNKYSFDEYSSLHFHSGLNRENKDYRLRYENEFGKGLPVRTGNLITYMTLNGGFENIDFYLKPSIRTYYEFSDNTRIGAGYYHKFIGSDFYQTELMFERKINTFDVTVRYTENNGQENQRLMLGIGYHF
ncbi:MAG: hypothetical protein CJD30_10915 [Sulfuricurvum sp. PD_MW2]|nr:MAG: hypothetical protein CJD30_10915 [Sulfuricurvum sp. PD_MW2]